MDSWKRFLFGVWCVVDGVGAGVAALTRYANNPPMQVLGVFLYVFCLMAGLYYIATGLSKGQ